MGSVENAPQQRLDRLRADVKKAREWAGDNLPAKSGLEMIIILERAIQESRHDNG